MNLSSILGFVFAGFVLLATMIGHVKSPSLFWDSHALLLVVGGTIAAGIIAFPLTRFRDLLKFIMNGVLFPIRRTKKEIAGEVFSLVLIDAGASESTRLPKYHPFLAEGYNLLRTGSFVGAEFKTTLQVRSKEFKDKYLNDAKMLSALAKFPPAFGLLGTVVALISILTSLSTDPGENLGILMATALVPTFWGIAFANFFLLPLADHAVKIAQDDALLRDMIIVSLTLVEQRVNSEKFIAMVTSFLSLGERESREIEQLTRDFRERLKKLIARRTSGSAPASTASSTANPNEPTFILGNDKPEPGTSAGFQQKKIK